MGKTKRTEIYGLLTVQDLPSCPTL